MTLYIVYFGPFFRFYGYSLLGMAARPVKYEKFASLSKLILLLDLSPFYVLCLFLLFNGARPVRYKKSVSLFKLILLLNNSHSFSNVGPFSSSNRARMVKWHRYPAINSLNVQRLTLNDVGGHRRPTTGDDLL